MKLAKKLKEMTDQANNKTSQPTGYNVQKDQEIKALLREIGEFSWGKLPREKLLEKLENLVNILKEGCPKKFLFNPENSLSKRTSIFYFEKGIAACKKAAKSGLNHAVVIEYLEFAYPPTELYDHELRDNHAIVEKLFDKVGLQTTIQRIPATESFPGHHSLIAQWD